MDGIRVGKRIVGSQSPVTIGWDNIPKVEGGPLKRLFFSWFQPAVLFGLMAFWYYAPNSIAKASAAIWHRHRLPAAASDPRARQPAPRELADHVEGTGDRPVLCRRSATMVNLAETTSAAMSAVDAMLAAPRTLEKFAWFTGLPLLVQAFLIVFIFDFGQYWMHRGMHDWYPLWLPALGAPTHITQLNVHKGAVGNPVELFLIGLGIGGRLRFPAARVPAARAPSGMSVGAYQHINVRFNCPRWWRWTFNTTEHHSLHHSQDFESTRSNYANTFIFIDRMFGTCIDGEAELLGMEGGRRMSIREQMLYPFTEGWKAWKERSTRHALLR